MSVCYETVAELFKSVLASNRRDLDTFMQYEIQFAQADWMQSAMSYLVSL